MLPRTLFSAEHEDFRTSVKRFIAEEITPNKERWEAQQHIDREAWKKAGELGMLCMTMPEEFGGFDADRRYSTIVMEELSYAGDSGCGFVLHSDIVANYVNNFASHEQKSAWLPKMATGEWISAIAMTEPGTGSDLQAIATTAVEDGDDYIINGSKIYITNGYLCDMVIVAVKTGTEEKGSSNVSLIMVEADTEGFSRGKPLNKVGMKAQDTCELFFTDMRVPKANLLGEPGQGFMMLMKELAWERLMIAIMAVAGCEAAFKLTHEYVQERKVFGKPVIAFQNSRFKLAEMKSETAMARVFVDRCIEEELQGKLGIDAAAAAKYLTSDLLTKVIDEGVQLHGGYGYMLEYPIARAYVDHRAMRIFGGTNEIMKEIISRML